MDSVRAQICTFCLIKHNLPNLFSKYQPMDVHCTINDPNFVSEPEQNEAVCDILSNLLKSNTGKDMNSLIESCISNVLDYHNHKLTIRDIEKCRVCLGHYTRFHRTG